MVWCHLEVIKIYSELGIGKKAWTGLAIHFDEAQILEVIALVGYYHTISFLCRGLDLPLESYAARFPC